MPETKKLVGIRVEPSLWEDVKTCAQEDDVGVAEWLRRLIRRSIAQRKRMADEVSAS